MIDWLSKFELIMAMNHGLLNGNIIPCPLASQFRWFFSGLFLWWVAKQWVRHQTFKQWQSRASLVDKSSSLYAAFSQACHQAGISRKPLLGLLERSPFPAFTCGVFEPTIFIEASFVESLNERELNAVFTHEMMHIRRHDNLRFLLLELALTTTPLWMIQFFGSFFLKNPWLLGVTLVATPTILLLGAWWLKRIYNQQREFVCDRLSTYQGADPLELASALVKASQFFQNRTLANYPGTVAIHAQACKGLIERRIQRLLYPKSPNRIITWSLRACGGIGAATVLFFFWKFYVIDSYDPFLQNWRAFAEQLVMK